MRNSSTKTPWHLRFGEKLKTAAAAVVVGIALLVGSNAAVQAACNPPVRDVCFHKSGDWTTEGSVEMIVDFHVPSSKRGTTYRIEWWGLRRFVRYRPVDPFEYVWGKSPQDDILALPSGLNELSHTFWFDPERNRMDESVHL